MSTSCSWTSPQSMQLLPHIFFALNCSRHSEHGQEQINPAGQKQSVHISSCTRTHSGFLPRLQLPRRPQTVGDKLFFTQNAIWARKVHVCFFSSSGARDKWIAVAKIHEIKLQDARVVKTKQKLKTPTKQRCLRYVQGPSQDRIHSVVKLHGSTITSLIDRSPIINVP